jgi:hypothetical protein
MRFCRECDRHDTIVRRGILLMRNLPSIRPSAEFGARLSARLRAEAVAGAAVARLPWLPRPPRLAQFASLAAAALVLALGLARVFGGQQSGVYRMAPVVASKPLRSASPFATPALVATVPTGMSIWPAIMMASQAPERFAVTELASTR